MKYYLATRKHIHGFLASDFYLMRGDATWIQSARNWEGGEWNDTYARPAVDVEQYFHLCELSELAFLLYGVTP